MVSIFNQKTLAHKLALLLLAVVCIAGKSQAQEQPHEYDSLANKYKNEDAVITNYTQHLVLSKEDGELVANSHHFIEKLYISNLSRSKENKDVLFRSDFHQLTNLKATALIPEKNGYKKVPCYNFAEINPDADNVFYDDNRLLIVSYAGLVKKSITRTNYSIEHTDLHMLPSFIYEENLPVDKATFEVTVPKYVKMGFVLRGSDTAMIKRSVEEKGDNITYKFTVEHVKAFKEFDHVPSHRYYLNHIIPYVISYKMSESNKKVDMLGDADQLYKYLYKFVRNLNMKEDTLLTQTVAQITKGDATPRAKAMHIYQWVQNNLHYIAFEKGLEGFVPREAAKVIRRKYGDCKDMAGVLVTMCQKAGIDAHYTWIGTREIPYAWTETPLPYVANHMICAIKLGEEWIFMDGTHPYIPFGSYPDGIQGKEAMIAIDAKNYKIMTVPVSGSDKNTIADSTTIRFADRKLSGTAIQSYSGSEAWDLGIMKMYYKGDDYEKRIKSITMRGSDKYHLDKYEDATGVSDNKDASIRSEFTIEDYVQKAGKQYFINMNLKHTFEDMRIDTEKRNIPYYYDNKEKIKEVVVLDVPKGYKISYLPPSAEGVTDDLWSYKVRYTTDKKKTRIYLTKEYELKTLTAKPMAFAANNKMVDDLKKLYKESVVLTANK